MSVSAMIFLLSFFALLTVAANIGVCVFYFKRQNLRDQKRRRNEHRAMMRVKADTIKFTDDLITSAQINFAKVFDSAKEEFAGFSDVLTDKLNAAIGEQYTQLNSVAKVVYEMQNPNEQDKNKNRLNYLSKEEREKRFISKHGLTATAKVG